MRRTRRGRESSWPAEATKECLSGDSFLLSEDCLTRQPRHQDSVTLKEERRVGRLVPLMRLRIFPGTEVHRGDAERRETGNVGPGLLRFDGANSALQELLHERMACPGRCTGREVRELDAPFVAHEIEDVLLGLLDRRVRREAMVEVDREGVRDDIS